MDSVRFENYVSQANTLAEKKLAEKNLQNPQYREALFSLIEGHRQEATGNRPFEEFFKGEAAFFNEQYDRALKHYIQATTVPHYQFFCYRASAFVSMSRSDLEKTTSFIEKGLSLFPEDPFLKQLKIELEERELEKANDLAPHTATNKSSEHHSQFLSQIFEEKPIKKELFSEELPSPTFKEKSKQSHFSTTTNYEQAAKQSYPEMHASANESLTTSTSQIAVEERPLSQSNASITLVNPNSILKELESSSTEPLKSTIRNFQLSQTRLTESYLQSRGMGSSLHDCELEILHGWSKALENAQEVSLLTKHSRMSSGGYYVRWNGKGIVLNPGKDFMTYFHQNGHHIRDIDYVIVSRDSSDTYDDIKEIYELNQELNKSTPELQIIHYYLNSETFQELSNYLKPSFKQARNTIHCLELFYDSPDVERMEIAEGIHLNYFPTQATIQNFQNRKNESLGKKTVSNLGLRLDLSRKIGQTSESRKIGFLGGCSWSPLLAHLMGSCDLLLLGFGHTQPSDYEKLAYNNDCLGLYGSLTLFEEILPRLLVCTEFDGLEGDVRFEAVKQIREQHSSSQNFKATPSHIIPGDIGLKIDLIHLQVLCSLTGNKIFLEQLHVAKSIDRFGRLKFLSKECTL